MATTYNANVTSGDWTLLYNGPGTSVGLQSFSPHPLLIAVATSAPSAGDNSAAGRLWMQPESGGGPAQLGLLLDAGDKVYGRLAPPRSLAATGAETGRVTVLA